MATPKIRSANAASTSSLAPTLPRTITLPAPEQAPSTQKRDESYTISLHKALSLPEDIKDRIYELFNDNMAPLSHTSSLDYTESSKREELFDETGRFILLRRGHPTESGEGGVDMPGALPSTTFTGEEAGEGQGENVSGEMVGYAERSFKLGHLEEAKVITSYELQLDASVRKMGLAKILMDEMELIGRKRKLDKAMLTCLKANTTALSFYRKQGYGADEIDPTRIDEEEEDDLNSDSAAEEDEGWEEIGHVVDYVILSKPLRTR